MHSQQTTATRHPWRWIAAGALTLLLLLSAALLTTPPAVVPSTNAVNAVPHVQTSSTAAGQATSTPDEGQMTRAAFEGLDAWATLTVDSTFDPQADAATQTWWAGPTQAAYYATVDALDTAIAVEQADGAIRQAATQTTLSLPTARALTP